MDLTITSQNNQEYLLIDCKGSVQTKEELFMHSQLVFDEIMKQGAQKILINDVEMHFPLDLSPYFGLVQGYTEDYPPEIRSLQIAVVVAGQYKEIAESWESLCVSRGLQFYSFTSVEEASRWLFEMI